MLNTALKGALLVGIVLFLVKAYGQSDFSITLNNEESSCNPIFIRYLPFANIADINCQDAADDISCEVNSFSYDIYPMRNIDLECVNTQDHVFNDGFETNE